MASSQTFYGLATIHALQTTRTMTDGTSCIRAKHSTWRYVCQKCSIYSTEWLIEWVTDNRRSYSRGTSSKAHLRVCTKQCIGRPACFQTERQNASKVQPTCLSWFLHVLGNKSSFLLAILYYYNIIVVCSINQ